jgi:leader peptidase (prepilin peptidase)/N-methyltransferase
VFDPEIWAKVPFHFWTLTFFVFGTIVGSFLNVCIYRMPLGLSVANPPSHCPHCKYSIPWYLNVPLLTWVLLQGKCKNCGAPIAARYFLVEFLTGVMFMLCWLKFGALSALLALVYCLMMAGFITATFIDFEHYIIPDEITIGGMFVGVICSFLVPILHFSFPYFHRVTSPAAAMGYSVLGLAVGGGLIYGILRLGKLMFGRRRVELQAGTKIIFSETGIHLPTENVPYEEVFYRDSDTIHVQASKVELVDRCYVNVKVELQPGKLRIGDDEFVPEQVHVMEAVADEITLPREAMGFGDVKFMAAIGAFLGAPATIFSLAVSSIIGSAVGLILIASGKREWSTKLPYGPYIAAAAVIWIFGGYEWVQSLFANPGH